LRIGGKRTSRRVRRSSRDEGLCYVSSNRRRKKQDWQQRRLNRKKESEYGSDATVPGFVSFCSDASLSVFYLDHY